MIDEVLRWLRWRWDDRRMARLVRSHLRADRRRPWGLLGSAALAIAAFGALQLLANDTEAAGGRPEAVPTTTSLVASSADPPPGSDGGPAGGPGAPTEAVVDAAPTQPVAAPGPADTAPPSTDISDGSQPPTPNPPTGSVEPGNRNPGNNENPNPGNPHTTTPNPGNNGNPSPGNPNPGGNNGNGSNRHGP